MFLGLDIALNVPRSDGLRVGVTVLATSIFTPNKTGWDDQYPDYANR
jgi:hypothetical protein